MGSVRRHARAGYDRVVALWSWLAYDHYWATMAVALLLLVLAAGCGSSSAGGESNADGGMTDAEWCDQIYPQHPDCLAEAADVDDTVEARRELYLTWTHECDATGGVFDCGGSP